MSIQVAGQVGPTAVNAADGAPSVPRLGHTGETIVQELHGRYFESTARGFGFTATNQAATAVSAGVATAYTGLLVYNPVGSGVVLVLNKVKLALTVAPAAASSLGLLQGFAATGGVSAAGALATISSNQVGSAKKSAAIAYAGATIVTPTWLMDMTDAAAAGAFPAATTVVDLEGLYQVLPGAFVAIGALTAVTGLSFISWEELPYNPQG